MAVVVLFLLVWPVLRQKALGIATVTNAEAVRLINHEQAVVVDVREGSKLERLPAMLKQIKRLLRTSGNQHIADLCTMFISDPLPQ